MLLTKSKISKRFKRLLGILIAAFIIGCAISATVYAETSMPGASDMIPDGTNIPDSNIEGAVESTSPLESITLPDAENGTVPSTDIAGGVTPDNTNPETSDSLSRVLGIVIAVIVVLAVILLIVALIPKKIYESRNRDGGN